MLDFVKSATCLVLDKRIDQAFELQEQFENLFPDKQFKPFLAGNHLLNLDEGFDYNRIDSNELPPIFHNTTSYATWRNKPGAFNAWKCHAQIFMEFLWTNEKYLWLMEDDCVFTEDTKEILEAFDYRLNWDGYSRFGGLYLGYYSNGNVQDWGMDPIRQVNGVAGFHSVILHREVIKRILHDTNYLPIGPFDEYTQKYHARPNFSPFYCVYPQVCLQRSGYSYVEQGNLEKPDRFKI